MQLPHATGSSRPGQLEPLSDIVRQQRERLRMSNYKCHIGHLCLGIALCFTFWAAFGWPIILAVIAIVTGAIGMNHLSSEDRVVNDHCCCAPLSALRHLRNLNITIIVFSVFCAVQGVMAAVVWSDEDKHVFVVFAIATSLIGLTLLALSVQGLRRTSAMVHFSEIDPQMVRVPQVYYPSAGPAGQPVQAIALEAQPYYPTGPQQQHGPPQPGGGYGPGPQHSTGAYPSPQQQYSPQPQPQQQLYAQGQQPHPSAPACN